MTEPALAGSLLPRAFLRLGGGTLAKHQLAFAQAAGAERIVCVARSLDPNLIALQHDAERAGLRFNVITGARGLASLITANDDLVVLADGLVPPLAETLNLASNGQCVLTLSAEPGVDARFERIDLNSLWAGVMLIGGSLVERLNDLPPDAELASSLLRIALQAGVPMKPVPPALVAEGRWLLLHDEAEAHSVETTWLDRQVTAHARSPETFASALLVRRFGPALLHAGSGGRSLAIAAAVLLAMAAVGGWLGWYAVAFACCAPSWIARRAAAQIASVEGEAFGDRIGAIGRILPFKVLGDIVLAGLIVVATPAAPDLSLWERALHPVYLVGLLWLVPQMLGPGWSAWLQDRFVLSLVLAGLTLAGLLHFAIPAFALCLLLLGIASRRSSARGEGITGV